MQRMRIEQESNLMVVYECAYVCVALSLSTFLRDGGSGSGSGSSSGTESGLYDQCCTSDGKDMTQF